MPQLRIENGKHAPLELLAPRHRQRHRWSRIASHAGDDVQQVLGVVRRACATSEREIIARPLALRAKPLCCSPDQWVEPVNSARQPAECVTDEIVTANVSQLVQQHGAPTVERPRVALGRKDDCWSEQAARKRHLRIFAAEKAGRLVELETIRDFPERIEPVAGIERTGPIDDPPYSERRVSERGHDDGHHGQPDEEHCGETALEARLGDCCFRRVV